MSMILPWPPSSRWCCSSPWCSCSGSAPKEATMITLETNPSCPGGLTALVALEQLGVRYELRVVPEGTFQRTYGAPGPRLIEEGVARLGVEAIGALVTRTLDAASASPALLAAHQHFVCRVM